MAEIIHLKKIFLITMIVSLVISAIMGVVVFMLGNFTDTEIKLLLTTGAITGFSLVGLFFSWFYEKRKLMPFSAGLLIYTLFAFVAVIFFIWGHDYEIAVKFAKTINSMGGYILIGFVFYWFFRKGNLKLFTCGGLILTIIAFITNFLFTWGIIDNEPYIRVIGAVFIIGISLLHISLLWLLKNEKIIVDVSLFFTIIMITIVAVLLVILVLLDSVDFGEIYFRTLGAFAILDGVGTVVTPIIRKVTSLHHEQNSQGKVKKK